MNNNELGDRCNFVQDCINWIFPCLEDDWSCDSLNGGINRCWNRQIYFKIIRNTESTVDCSIRVVKRMFAKTLATNRFAKDCILIANEIARDWDWETGHLTIVFVYLYWSRDTGKFPFSFVWRLYVAATLFCPELVYYYIMYMLTMLVLLGKITTWLKLSPSSYATTRGQPKFYCYLTRVYSFDV